MGASNGERFSCGAPKAKPRSDTNLKNDFSHIMLQRTCVPLINSLPADIICDSFDLVVVQWNRETQTLRRACGAQKAFSWAGAEAQAQDRAVELRLGLGLGLTLSLGWGYGWDYVYSLEKEGKPGQGRGAKAKGTVK